MQVDSVVGTETDQSASAVCYNAVAITALVYELPSINSAFSPGLPEATKLASEHG